MNTFLNLVDSFTLRSIDIDCQKIDVSLLDQIIIHPQLDEYLSDEELFATFWEKWKKLDKSDWINSYNAFKRLLSRMEEKNNSKLFPADVVIYFIETFLELLSNNDIHDIEESYNNYRLCVNIIIQRHKNVEFLIDLYNKMWQGLQLPNIGSTVEDIIHEVLENIVSRLLLLPEGYTHFNRLLATLSAKSFPEKQYFSLLKAHLLQLTYLPATKEINSFKGMLQYLPLVAASYSPRNFFTYIHILRESLDLVNIENIVEQWNALINIKNTLSSNPNIARPIITAIDILQRGLIPYLPVEIKQNLGNDIPVDSVVSCFSEEISSQPVIEHNFLPAWENFCGDKALSLLPDSETESLLEIINRKSCHLTAKKLLTQSFNSAQAFNVIWNKVMQDLDSLVSTRDPRKANHEKLFVQMLLSMSGHFNGSSNQRQENCEKLLYILDFLAEEPSSNLAYNSNMIDSISLIIKNLLNKCPPKTVNDFWGHVLSMVFQNTTYFFPLVGELFPLIGSNEKMVFWYQLQAFLSTLKDKFSLPQVVLDAIEKTLYSLQMMLPKIMQGTHDMVTQQIISLNQTLRVALRWSFHLGEQVEFFVHKVRLYAILSVTQKEHREMLNKGWRDILVHSEVMNHPLCVLASIALDRNEWPNTNGINRLLNADVLWEMLLPAKNKMSLNQYKPFLISSLFTLVEWSIYKFSFRENSVPNETHSLQVVDKINKLITHPNSIVREAVMEVLQKLMDIYHFLQVFRSRSYAHIPYALKDIIGSYSFNSHKDYSQHENNNERNLVVLERFQHFFEILEKKLKDSPALGLVSSVEKALLLIATKKEPSVTTVKNNSTSSLRSFLGKRTHPMITRSCSKKLRADQLDEVEKETVKPRSPQF